MPDDKPSSALSHLSDQLNADAIGESTVSQLPKTVVKDLLATGIGPSDPSTRDFGDRYQYRSVIGEGGQGIVVSAFDRLLEREVAVKALKQHGNQIREEYLEREARLSGVLEHPNIPPTYDIGHDEAGSPYFVMRKVAGTSLDEVMAQSRRAQARPPSERQGNRYSRLRLLAIFTQVCHAIEYAHSRGVLHLDIKPQNIKLGPFGEVFVLDWGFAARKDEPPKVIGGTPIYIAPERLRHAAPDERADIYSLGVLLYRMLTGTRPFDVRELSFKEFREQYDQLEPIPPRQRDSTIPVELDAIVMKAIAKDRNARYQRAHDLAQDLQRFLDGVPVTAYRTGPLVRAWKFVRRHRAISILAAALVLVFIGAGLLAHRSHRAEVQRQRLEQAQVRARAARTRARELRNMASLPFEKGREFLSATPPRLAAARSFFSQAINIDPTFADAFYERGRVNMRLGAPNEALTDFRQATTLKPSLIMAHYHAGTVLMEQYRLRQDRDPAEADFIRQAARREFEAMQNIDPEDEYSYMGLANLHFLERDFAAALELCDRIEDRNPSLNEVHYLRGLIHTRLGEPDEALASYDRYLAEPTDNAAAHSNRGLLRQRRGDIEGALDDYSRALELDPDNEYARNNRGFLLYRYRDDNAAALQDLNHAAMVRPDYHMTYMNRAAVYESQQRWADAEEDYNWAGDLRFQALGHADPVILLRQGTCFLREGKFEQAQAAFAQAAKHIGPRHGSVLHYRRALVEHLQGRDREALGFLAMSRQYEDPLPFYRTMLELLCRFRLGDSPAPDGLLPAAESTPGRPWLTAIARYYRGLITPEKTLLSAESPDALCETQTYLGMYQLLVERNENQARARFAQAVGTGTHLRMEHVMARHALAKLIEIK